MRYIAILIVAVLFTGCSRNVAMSGKVMFADNSEPLTVGTVVFQGTASQARGNIQPNGTFQLGFFGEKDGVPKGEYKVYIDGANHFENTGDIQKLDMNPKKIVVIHPKYENPETSGLTFTVDGSQKTFDIKVERP